MIVAVAAVSLLAIQEPENAELSAASRVAALEFTEAEIEQMLARARENIRSFHRMRQREIPNSIAPAFTFQPTIDSWPTTEPGPIPLPETERPENLGDLAFADIRTLASLVKSRKVSCVELTELFLARLDDADKALHCVISRMPERAVARARELDALLADGNWLGPLHGIPYGAKDLLSAKGAPTTWGAKPYQTQVIDEDAAVIERLEAAGAVLCAKLALGALAWGDVWFGGKTRNPWNPEQGSSGSSAGSAAATAAGALPFAIGSETLGSIVSPSTRCGCSSLRPTFGVVDTRGAMALSWTMDKLGPICRSADDAALVFAELVAAHPHGYRFAPRFDRSLKGIRVGYDARAFERTTGDKTVLDELRSLGIEPSPIELPDYPTNAMMVILNCEAAAAFDELTRSNRDDELVRQIANAWPNEFRVARLIPAVEYIQAQRLRTMLMRDMDRALENVDVYVHPTFGGATLGITNLTGHPTFVAPFRFRDDGTPRSICFTGKPYGEAALMAVAQAWQSKTDYHSKHPGD